MTKKFDESVYNEIYYQTSFGGIPYNRESHGGHWIKFFLNISKEIKELYNPKRVLDVGCAKGFIVESMRDLGINAYGFDISVTAFDEIREDIKPYCSIGSVDDPNMYKDQFDLITCIEVLEHVTEDMAQKAIELMCNHTTQILFSSSPSDFEEPTHINVQKAEYWDELFASHGFVRAHEEWQTQHVAPHTVLYRKRSQEMLTINREKIGDILLQLEHLNDKCKSISHKVENESQNIYAHLEERLSVTSNELLQKIEVLNDSKIRINSLIDDNYRLKEEVNNLLIEIEEINGNNVILNEQLQILKNNEGDLLHTNNILNAQVTQLNSKIDQIMNGRAFKVLSKYWKVRDKALPLGSQRREFVKSMIGRRKASEHLNHSSVDNDSTAIDLWNIGFNKWLDQTKPLDDQAMSKQKEQALSFSYRPLISILLPVYIIPIEVFKETISSVLSQTYENWELCIAVADKDNQDLVDYLSEISKVDSRIKVLVLKENEGISKNTNHCISLATGDFFALLDHDDLLTSDALYVMVDYINKYPNSDFLYSDKDQINAAATSRLNPLFKHKWSWVTMLSANYPTHFCVIRSNLFEKIGVFDSSTDGAQDWDIFLKASEVASEITHVPHVLYHWRIIETSVASGLQAKPYVIEAQNKALNNYIQRRKLNGELIRNDDHTFRLMWNKNNNLAYNAVVYLEQEDTLKDLLFTLNSLQSQELLPNNVFVVSINPIEGYFESYNKYFNVELIKADNYSEGFLLACNSNSNSTDALFLIKAGVSFENSDMAVELVHWIHEGGYAAASGMLLDQEKFIVNAGYVFDDNNTLIEPFNSMPINAYTTYGSACWYREYLAVSECALMIDLNSMKTVLNVIQFKDNIRESLIKMQILMSENTNKSIIYNPYVKATLKKSKSVDSDFVYAGVIKDGYYNKAVWDWNPQYLQSRFLMNNQTKPNQESAPSIWSGYTSDAMILATLFDFNNNDLLKNKKIIDSNESIESVRTAMWFLPPFSTAFYGGIHTILRFAEYMTKHYAVENKFVIVGVEETYAVKNAIKAAFPSLSGSEVFGLSNDTKIKSLPQSDISFCTLWTTAYSLLKYNKTARKYYFLQDWEPLFYPAGSTSAQVEATYRFGFQAICNTVSLKISYEELGGKAIHFTPAVDTSVFYPPTTTRDQDPYLVFLYGRPGNPRNCFELAIPALRKVKEHFGDRVRIVSAGADWDAAAYGAEGVIEHLGMLPYKATGDLYRKCHVGLAMMMTRHPSYLPFEMMACGCVVVANKNSWNEWMLRDGDNCKVAEPTVSCISEAIIEIIENEDVRNTLSENAVNYIKNEHSNWSNEFENICRELF